MPWEVLSSILYTWYICVATCFFALMQSLQCLLTQFTRIRVVYFFSTPFSKYYLVWISLVSTKPPKSIFFSIHDLLISHPLVTGLSRKWSFSLIYTPHPPWPLNPFPGPQGHPVSLLYHHSITVLLGIDVFLHRTLPARAIVPYFVYSAQIQKSRSNLS